MVYNHMGSEQRFRNEDTNEIEGENNILCFSHMLMRNKFIFFHFILFKKKPLF